MKNPLGLKNNVIGSAGMMGKSSGAGKCVMPNVCQRTRSVLSKGVVGSAAIQVGRPGDGVEPEPEDLPEVWGTWRPAGWSWSSASNGGGFSFDFMERVRGGRRGGEAKEREDEDEAEQEKIKKGMYIW